MVAYPRTVRCRRVIQLNDFLLKPLIDRQQLTQVTSKLNWSQLRRIRGYAHRQHPFDNTIGMLKLFFRLMSKPRRRISQAPGRHKTSLSAI